MSKSVLLSADHLADKERFLFNKDLGVNPLKIVGNKTNLFTIIHIVFGYPRMPCKTVVYIDRQRKKTQD